MTEKKTKEPSNEQIEAKKEELAKKIRTAKISEIAYKLKDCSGDDGKRCTEPRFAVFLGAGASLQAGIDSAGKMMKTFRDKIFERDANKITDDKEKEQWLQDEVLSKGEGNDYSKLFEAYERTQRGRQNYISKLIKDKQPSFGYAMLASMVARGFINTILTTNFDDLMFVACNKFTGIRPVIYSYGIMATEMKFSSPHSKILKIHGDYLYSALANTEGEMGYFNQDPNMKAQVAHALNEYELIVFGYSGNDDSVMNILDSYPGGKELYWCHWEEELPSLRALELLHKKDGTLVPVKGFDDAMYDIHKVIDFRLDEVLAGVEERRREVMNYIDEFDNKYSTRVLTSAIEERKGSKEKIDREPETWYESFDLAFQAAENKDDETAEKYYLRTIELNPDVAEAYNNLGVLLDKDETRLPEAEKNYRKAIALNPNYADAYTNLGIVIGKDDKRYEEAEKYNRKAIELNPNLANAYYNLGVLLDKDERRRVEAEESYRKAIEIDPNYAIAYNNLGTLLFKNEDTWQEAEKNYRKAIELDPGNAVCYSNLGILLAKHNKIDEAIEALQTSTKLDKNYVDPRVSLAGIYKRQGKSADAKKYADEAFALIKGNEFYALACLSSALDNKEDTLKFLKLEVENDWSSKNVARNDPDFEWLRDDERFLEIVGKDD